jgi:hypothetical protein
MSDEITFKRADLGDGVIYEGEILNEARFVYGKYSFQGITYIGEFDENSDMAGMGKLTIKNGKNILVSIGIFKGKGTNGLPLLNGIGTRYMNGHLHQTGMFVDDNQHGYGTTYFEDGTKYEGEFAHGRLHGKGVLTKVDGKSFGVVYENGKAVSTK